MEIPNSTLGSPSPTDTSPGTSFSSTTNQLPFHVQPTQIPSGNLSPTVNSNTLATASLNFPSSSSTLGISSSSGPSQNQPHFTLTNTVNVSPTPPDHDHPATASESTSTTSLATQGLEQPSTRPGLSTTTFDSTSTTFLTSQGLRQLASSTATFEGASTLSLATQGFGQSSTQPGLSTTTSESTSTTSLTSQEFGQSSSQLGSSTTTFEGISTTSLTTQGLSQSSTQPGLSTTAFDSTSTTPLTSQGLGQSSTQLRSSTTSLAEGSSRQSIPITMTIHTQILSTTLPIESFRTSLSQSPPNPISLNQAQPLTAAPFPVTFQTSIVTAPFRFDSAYNESFPDNRPDMSSPSITTSASTSVDISQSPTFPPSLTTSSWHRKLKTVTVSAPTLTVTKLPESRSLDSILGGSIGAGIASLLLCALFLGLYLIRRRYKKAVYKLAHHITPLSDVSYHPVSSASAFVTGPLNDADDLEIQRKSMAPSAYVRRHTLGLNPYFPEHVSHPIQAQSSASTFDATSLPPREQGSNIVTTFHSCRSSFNGENYYNVILGDFPLPYSQYTEHDVSVIASNSDIGDLETPGMRPLSRVTPVSRESVPAQIGIAI